MLERIDKILAHLGIGTRKEAKKLCKAGFITINGEIVNDSSVKIDPEKDELAIDGQVLKYRKNIYIMLHKPAGIISATEDNLHQTVVDILPEEYIVFNPFPIGRLDKDTEGLLLLTNDGQFSHRLLSPKRLVDKTYYVEVNKSLTEANFQSLEQGVTLDDGYVTMPAKVNPLSNTNALKHTNALKNNNVITNVLTNVVTDNDGLLNGLELNKSADSEKYTEIIPEQFSSAYAKQRFLLTITEGKFHQVKRMVEAVGSEVVYLKRIKMGGLLLDASLLPGDSRELTEKEIAILSQ